MEPTRTPTGRKIRPVMKAFIVLGMHHSATSLVAEAFHHNGVDMGEEGLSRVHYEDMRFVRLNDRILKAAGGSWKNPPNEYMIRDAARGFMGAIETLLDVRAIEAKKQEKYLWGWKDPRQALLMEVYWPIIREKYNPHIITIMRSPREVARSLARSKKADLEVGEALARLYQERINRFMRQRTHS